jgi:hypothetical protein
MVPPVKKAPLLDLRVERGGPGPLQRLSTRLRYRVAQDVLLLEIARRSVFAHLPTAATDAELCALDTVAARPIRGSAGAEPRRLDILDYNHNMSIVI